MHRIFFSISVFTGLLGLIFAVNSELPLPVGLILITIASVFCYLAISSKEVAEKIVYDKLPEKLGLSEVILTIVSVKDAIELQTLVYKEQTEVEQSLFLSLKESHSILLDAIRKTDITVSALLKDINNYQDQLINVNKKIYAANELQTERICHSILDLNEITQKANDSIDKQIQGSCMKLCEVQEKQSEALEEALEKSISSIGDALSELPVALKMFEEIEKNLSCTIIRELESTLRRFNENEKNMLDDIIREINSALSNFDESNQALSLIITDQIEKALNDFNEKQGELSQNTTDAIKKAMNKVGALLSEVSSSLLTLPRTIEGISTKNTDIVKQMSEGYEKYVQLTSKLMQQMTSLANEDQKFLNGILSNE
jgi:hypothetical protein